MAAARRAQPEGIGEPEACGLTMPAKLESVEVLPGPAEARGGGRRQPRVENRLRTPESEPVAGLPAELEIGRFLGTPQLIGFMNKADVHGIAFFRRDVGKVHAEVDMPQAAGLFGRVDANFGKVNHGCFSY